MKHFAAIVLITGVLGVGASAQAQFSGMFTNPEPVSLRFHNAPLGQVLRSLSTITGVTILIDARIDTTRSMNLAFKDAAMADVLNAVIGAANAKATVLNSSTISIEPL